MSSSVPVVLDGSNLGERHQCLNAIVNTAFQQKIDLKSILQTDEKSPIDRIYKIDLASEYRDVDYILHSLKDDDMLYVSRALKSHWLLEPRYRDVINPQHLEEELFPHMIQPAINKMRHWLQINLKESTRCEEFYAYYKDRHQIAIKFLWHCSNDYILAEMSTVLDKLTPQDLKIICETCPQAAQVYLEGLHTNKAALSRYLENKISYFKSLQCILKLNSLLYLDILEKYFNISEYKPLSPTATRYIMKNHKDRFEAKPELYACYILHLKTLANFLTADEAKDLTLKLAKAEYLGSCFSFQKVEPLIKRINPVERAAFKKQIFVDKAIGEKIKDWQYPIPITFKSETIDNRNIFLDQEHKHYEYFTDMLDDYCCLEMCKVGQCMPWFRKSELDILFDRYRFKGFENTFLELKKKLLVESTVEGRMNILLVLVSKTGGVLEQLNKLLKHLIVKHINEPINLRAAVVRSLVKRACVWRLPTEQWNMLLEFGRYLGLEGQNAELLCREGLHAVILRHLINDLPLSNTLKTAFLCEVSTLTEYKLNSEERMLVGTRLGKILLDGKPDMFLEVLAVYKIKITEIPDAEKTLVEMARSDSDLARRLFESRIGRRYLLKETFSFINNSASYMNALKHDTSVLENGKSFASLVSDKRPRHDRFLQSLALYFNEPNGLADQHKASLVVAMKTSLRPWFARAVNILSTNTSFLDSQKKLADMEINETTKKQLAAAFRATAHKCRPMVDMKSLDWRWLGAKAVANRVLVCRETERDSNIKSLLQWRRAARIAIRLGLASKSSTETFITASKLRPAVALKIACEVYLKNKTIDPLVWEVTRKLIENINTEKTNKYLIDKLKNNDDIPENIKPEYWEVVYKVLLRIDKTKTLPILCRLENLLPSVNKEFLRSVIDTFLNEELSPNRFTFDDNVGKRDRALYVRIIAKYLLACVSKAEQDERLDNICNVFFEKLEILKNMLKETKEFRNLYVCLQDFVKALKYNKVFLGDYVSSLPVFERVLQRMKLLLPIEQYFALYVEIHLVMLYYKSLKQTMAQKPSIFTNLDQHLEEAIETFGLQLGQNIGLEVKELTTAYYFSIIDIYKDELIQYLNEFNWFYGFNAIVVPVLKGLVKCGQTESLLLALIVLNRREGDIPDSSSEIILKDLKAFNNQTVNFFFNANSLV